MIVGSAITPKDNVSQKFELLKDKLIDYGFELNESVKKNGAIMLRPQSAGQILIGKGNVLLIGEAAGWISPTSAEGLSYAFRSAIALAKSFAGSPGNFLGKYYKETNNLRLNIMQKNLKSPFMYNPLIRRMVLKTGLLSMNVDEQN